ncbi:MAG: endonuclease/exonuclease/phosphatase family protein [Vicinamibacteria bacterium]|nr:endonuclease/exonuclease/phosphatase family protein [Vicinamibacteria bacterium]
MAFSVLTYNIRRGGLGREDALASVIRDSGADLVVLQEATSPAVVARLADGAGMAQWMARRGSSLAFLSRQPVVSYRWRRTAWAQHAILELVPQPGLVVFGVHLSAVHSNWTEWRRVKEVRGLLAMAKAEGEDVHVLTGDFNTLAPGEALDLTRLPPRLRALTWLTGKRIRWKTVALMLEAGYLDAFRLVEPDGRGYTFPTWDPHLRLDYAFMPARDAVRLRGCRVLRSEAAGIASDHLPLEMSIEMGELASALHS